MAFAVATGSRGTRKGRVKPDINVTPLVDVVLVLLIIFMVVTPLLAKQFWVHVPVNESPARPAADAEPPVVVTVDGEGRVRINRDVVPLEELEGRLRRVLAARGDRTIFFDAQNAAPYGRAVEVLDRCRGGGATTIAVATEPLADTH